MLVGIIGKLCPEFAKCADDRFAELIDDPRWPATIASLAKRVRATDYGTVEALIQVFHQRAPTHPHIRRLLLPLYLGSLTNSIPVWLCRFASQFTGPIEIEGVIPLHRAIVKLVALGTFLPHLQAFQALVGPVFAFAFFPEYEILGDIRADLSFDPVKIATLVKPVDEFGKSWFIIEYFSLVLALTPKRAPAVLASLKAAFRNEISFGTNPQFGVVCLVLHTVITVNKNAKELLDIHEKVAKRERILLDPLFNFYVAVLLIDPWIALIVCQVFSKLNASPRPKEAAFFEKFLPPLPANRSPRLSKKAVERC
jgi:hypothetical protein